MPKEILASFFHYLIEKVYFCTKIEKGLYNAIKIAR